MRREGVPPSQVGLEQQRVERKPRLSLNRGQPQQVARRDIDPRELQKLLPPSANMRAAHPRGIFNEWHHEKRDIVRVHEPRRDAQRQPRSVVADVA